MGEWKTSLWTGVRSFTCGASAVVSTVQASEKNRKKAKGTVRLRLTCRKVNTTRKKRKTRIVRTADARKTRTGRSTGYNLTTAELWPDQKPKKVWKVTNNIGREADKPLSSKTGAINNADLVRPPVKQSY